MAHTLVSALLDLLTAVFWLAGWLFRGVMLLVGPFLLHRWWKAREAERRCARWHATTGTIRRSELEERTFTGMRRTRYQGYRADIAYEYHVDGRPFSATSVTTFHTGLNGGRDYVRHRPAAEALLQRYPAGARVQVWYDPDDEGASILEQGPSDAADTLLFVGIAFCVGTAILLT